MCVGDELTLQDVIATQCPIMEPPTTRDTGEPCLPFQFPSLATQQVCHGIFPISRNELYPPAPIPTCPCLPSCTGSGKSGGSAPSFGFSLFLGNRKQQVYQTLVILWIPRKMTRLRRFFVLCGMGCSTVAFRGGLKWRDPGSPVCDPRRGLCALNGPKVLLMRPPGGGGSRTARVTWAALSIRGPPLRPAMAHSIRICRRTLRTAPPRPSCRSRGSSPAAARPGRRR